MVRRGLDPDEVREKIRSLETEIERLRDRAVQLERDLAAAVRPRVDLDGVTDETLSGLIGDEAAQIIGDARTEAAEIRQRAEDEAVQIVAAAYEEAARVRESVQQEAVYLQRTTAEQVESELASARARGLEMVTEAREYREKVLADLAQRRDLARQQIRALIDGRDHLLRAFEVARLAAVDIIVELEQAAPNEDAAAREERLAREVAESAVYDAESDITPAAGIPQPVTSGPVLVESDEDDLDHPTGVDQVASPRRESLTDHPASGPLAARAQRLAPLVESLSKQFRRVIADEQNEVLTAIRRSEGISQIAELLPSEDDHIERYASAASADLRQAASAGAQSVSGDIAGPSDLNEAGPDLAGAGDLHGVVSARVAEELILPMRERLERVIDSSQGNRFELSAFVRSAYREWKQRCDQLAEELAMVAFGSGAYRALPEGALVVWVPSPSPTACAEGHTNVGVVIRVPELFPSGHQYPPVSSHCRCLIERVPE